MKNLYVSISISAILLLISSCSGSDDSDPGTNDPDTGNNVTVTGFSPDRGSSGDEIVIIGTGFDISKAGNQVKFNGIEAEIISARDTKLTVDVPSGATTGKVTVTVNEITGTSESDFKVLINKWTQKADFGGGIRTSALALSIGDKGYIGTGFDGESAYKKDFWEYNPATDVWTQKADVGGDVRTRAFSFSINDKGYIGCGQTAGESDLQGPTLGDFWEYDPATNKWVQKADFAGGARKHAAAFSLNGKGYVGTGNSDEFGMLNDLWEYDPQTDKWTQKANFPGAKRHLAVGLAIDSKGYMGTGWATDEDPSKQKDFWEYNPETDEWTRKADFAGGLRNAAVAFSLDSRGYLGTGSGDGNNKMDFWEYNPEIDVWIQRAHAAGAKQRRDAVGFTVNGKGYMGTGSVGSGYEMDLWEYQP